MGIGKVSIAGGGQVESLKGKLTAIKFHPMADSPSSKLIAMILESKKPNSEGFPDDNLSYLTLDEAMDLVKELNSAIRETIDQYTR